MLGVHLHPGDTEINNPCILDRRSSQFTYRPSKKLQKIEEMTSVYNNFLKKCKKLLWLLKS